MMLINYTVCHVLEGENSAVRVKERVGNNRENRAGFTRNGGD